MLQEPTEKVVRITITTRPSKGTEAIIRDTQLHQLKVHTMALAALQKEARKLYVTPRNRIFTEATRSSLKNGPGRVSEQNV